MRAHPFEFRLFFFETAVGKGDVRNTALDSQRIPPLRANCREGGGKRARREQGKGTSQEAAREGAHARPFFSSVAGSHARPPRRLGAVCDSGGAVEVAAAAAAEEYVREGSVDSAGGNRHACGQEAEAE